MNQNITDTNNVLSKNLQILRQKNGFSKYAAAKQIGISYTYYSELERGKKANPCYEILKKIAAAYDVKVDQLYEEIL